MVVVVKNKNFKFILKTTTFVILVACFAYFYLIEIANLYFAESTTFSTKRFHAKNSVLPSVSFCMDKGLKPDVLIQHTGSSNRGVFNGKSYTKKGSWNISLVDLYDLATYKINRDFALTVRGKDLVVGKNIFIDKNEELEIKEFATLKHGICYSAFSSHVKDFTMKLTPKGKA